jgi:sugar lactone lactonase YvrE
MYHADTPPQTIHAYTYDPAAGTLADPRLFARFVDDGEFPDGCAVDSEGCYWIALYRGGRVLRIAPGGDVVATHALPAMCPTMCAFGGTDLRTLYVTSARQMRDADELARLPQSGGIFAMTVDTPGLPEPQFAG